MNKVLRRLELKEIQSLSLEGLVYLRDFLEKKHLRYYLSWGTLLGAVRHGGFIPWDDDIDIWMPRKDYNILLSMADECGNEEWEILHNSFEHRYLLPYAKLSNKRTICKPSLIATGYMTGLSIDIFPLDYINMPVDLANKELYSTAVPCFKRLFRFHVDINVHASKVNRLLHYLFFYMKNLTEVPYSKIMSDYDCLFAQNDDSSMSAIDYISKGYVVFENEWFDMGVTMQFEGEKFVVPNNSDKVLSALYGDYMTLPPIEMRVPSHLYDTWSLT
jgi:lipopolysaccharide cholinephosphotransferase